MNANKRQKVISRRTFIRLATTATTSILATACVGTPLEMQVTEPIAPTARLAEQVMPLTPGLAYQEAPILAELVKAGKLPPVEQRLPNRPMVMPVAEQIGNYGGTIRRGFKGPSDRVGPTKLQDHSLVWYDKDLNLRPHIAESWETNADATEWTFHLRKGMKWSDGVSFTTENVKYWYNHELKHPDLIAYKGNLWATGPERRSVEVEIIDDYTFKFKFAAPSPLFIYKVSRPATPTYSPGHYMKQFHIDLTDDKAALAVKVKEAGVETWDQYYTNRGWWHLNPEKPSVGPWIAQNVLSEELFIMARNPYFFAVDNAGNQLPYVDRVNHHWLGNVDLFNLWIIRGKIDFQARHVNVANFTLFKEHEAEGAYKVYVSPSANHLAMQPNHTTKNKRLREFFNNRDVRVGLSLAVDRKTINELIYDGLTTPRQYSPLSLSPQYYPKLSNAHIAYDPVNANALLDAAGYIERSSDGFRRWKDNSGEVLSFIIEGTVEPSTPDEDAVLQVIKYFADVGVKAVYKGVERSLYEEHVKANAIEAAWWGGDRTVLPLVSPGIFLGTVIDRPWAVAWGKWRDTPDDANAEEPPADHWIRNIWKIWEQIAVESDEDNRNELFKQILDIWATELPMIGILGEIPALVIVKQGIHNYLEEMPLDDTTGDEHLLNTETYFWADPENHL